MTSNKLTWDHKPEVREEKKRIEKTGGRVVFDGYANHRVYAKHARYPGLNMSRALGDLMGHQDAGISAEPTVSDVEIQDEDLVLIICSDGIWEFIDASEAVKIVADQVEAGDAMAAAETLSKVAWDRWIQEE